MFWLISVSLIFLGGDRFAPPSDEKINTVLSIFQEDPEEALSSIKDLGLTYYDFGIRASLKRPEEAISYFKKLIVLHPEDQYNYSYGIAWTYWSNLQISSAHNELSYLLSVNPPPKLRAIIYYLLSQIFARYEDFNEADKHAVTSGMIYEKLGQKGGAVNCLISRATICFFQNDFANATMFLNKAETLNKTRENPLDTSHQIDYYTGGISFKNSDYKSATGYYIKVIQNPYADETSRQFSKTNLSICRLLQNDLVGAIKIAREVDQYISDNQCEDQLVGYYNKIAWVFIMRCQGIALDSTTNKILEWNKNKGEAQDIKDMLGFVNTVECPKGLQQ